MKSIYTTLDAYNQYSEETEYAILPCPELFSQKKKRPNTESSLTFFETDVDGESMDPVIDTNAGGQAFVVQTPMGFYIFIKTEALYGLEHISIYDIKEDDTIGEKICTIYQKQKKSLETNSFFHFIPIPSIDFENSILIFSTKKFPNGEISGVFTKCIPQ